MLIKIWKGFHSDEVKAAIKDCWQGNDTLLILHPPVDLGTDFVNFLPQGKISWLGDWENANLPGESGAGKISYSTQPVLGVFTSATSSGLPRLILYSRENILSSISAILSLFDPLSIERIFSYAQPFHTFGLLLGYVMALENKWELTTGSGKYNHTFHEAWFKTNHKGLLTLGTPTHFRDLLQYCEENKITPDTSYACIMGGAKVPVSLWEDVQEKLLIKKPSIGYGASEASPGITHLPPGIKPVEEGEIGYTLRSVKIHQSESSGIKISGPSVCLAIISTDGIEFPESIIISDHLSQRSDNVWVYHGRADNVLNRGGEKISLDKIEQEISRAFSCPVMAIAVPHERLGQELGLLIQGEIDVKEITAELKKHFVLSFDERNFHQVHSLPLNANAKPDKKEALRLILKVRTHV